VPTAVSEVGLPAVLKPRRGAGGRYVCAVHTMDEGTRAAAEYFSAQPAGGPMLLEEFLPGDPDAAGRGWGDYVSVESLVDDGNIHTICVTGKFPLVQPFRERGYFLPSTVRAPVSAQTVAVAESAIKALGVQNGVLHTELKLTPTGPRTLELNGRIGGHVADLLRRSSGFDIVKAALLLAMGEWEGTPVLDISRVSYQYILHSPPAATMIFSVDGLDEVRALEGVDLLDFRTVAGRHLDWRDGALGMLGKAYGQVADHEALLDIAERIEAAFRPTYRYAHDGPAQTLNTSDGYMR
jgi:predicted ATP-grasp superfamily ATP-dependent carboligase